MFFKKKDKSKSKSILDDIAIENRALTPEEILVMFSVRGDKTIPKDGTTASLGYTELKALKLMIGTKEYLAEKYPNEKFYYLSADLPWPFHENGGFVFKRESECTEEEKRIFTEDDFASMGDYMKYCYESSKHPIFDRYTVDLYEGKYKDDFNLFDSIEGAQTALREIVDEKKSESSAYCRKCSSRVTVKISEDGKTAVAKCRCGRIHGERKL